ncbi:MAG: exodeoxyribonuclease VII small subunit [Myxococcales bacterium FL481]|nr:MAG: exodeoxyribonuclease VII small subunit [Myxococcales bacterium FL481]
MVEPHAEHDVPKSPPDDPSPGVDSIIAELERHVDALESGELPLEEALARFEAGVRLARQGTGMLDALEQRVEMLLADGQQTEPFATEEDGAFDPDEP